MTAFPGNAPARTAPNKNPFYLPVRSGLTNFALGAAGCAENGAAAPGDFPQTEKRVCNMIKRVLFVLALAFPLAAPAQSNWELPAAAGGTEETAGEGKTAAAKEKTKAANEEDLPYLAGAVPEVDGKVVFRADIETTGLTAEEAYRRAYEYMDGLTKEEIQTDKSTIAIVDRENHGIVATYVEKLTFRKQALSLDQADFGYIIITNCTDGGVRVSIERLFYDYPVARKVEHINAEDMITDELMLSKDGTKLKKYNSRFRKATVNRMREIIDGFRNALK